MLIHWQSHTWSDGCRGCGQQGGLCTQALVKGFVAIYTGPGGSQPAGTQARVLVDDNGANARIANDCNNPPLPQRPTMEQAPEPTGEVPGGMAPSDPSLWQDITIAPENRCSPYDPGDYHYPQSVEPLIVETRGGIYGPYTGTWFQGIRETDIEHIVARSEAHDSGLCAADAETRARFASDLLNLTLASPGVNRHRKVTKDVTEWLPDLNRCWFVARTLEVRQKYNLSIDRAELDAAKQVLAGCESTEIVMTAPSTVISPKVPAPEGPLDLYDDNGNRRITCVEPRAHGIAPVHREHPAYEYMQDADGDGVVCE